MWAAAGTLCRVPAPIRPGLSATDGEAGAAATSGLAEPVERDPLTGPSGGYAWLLVVGGLFGLAASFALTVDRIRLLKNPSTQLECSINAAVNCASVMSSPQGEAFGFANPVIGLFAFGGLVTFGAGLLAGARYARWMWLGLTAGTGFGIGFVGWLIFQSIFRIQRLCPWCMVVWAVMVPIALSTLIHMAGSVLPMPAAVRRVAAFGSRWYVACLIVAYAIIAGLIAWNFGLAVFG